MDNDKETYPSNWFYQKVQAMPEGVSRVTYRGRSFTMSKTTFNKGKSFKIFADEIGGEDYVSLNLYVTSEGVYVKPCEQPILKAQDFLERYTAL